MAVSINGTTGISGVDGSASAPAIKGTDANSGISYASDTVNINTGGSTRATVDSSGRLLIGDTDADNAVSDSDNLVIGAASGDNGMTIVSQSGNYNGSIRFSDGSNSGSDAVRGTIQYYHGQNYMRFLTDGSECMRLTNNGFLKAKANASSFIGSTATYHELVANTDNQLILDMRNESGSGYGILMEFNHGSSSNYALLVYNYASGSSNMFIRTDGDLENVNNSYGGTSDVKLKENIIDAKSQWDDIKALKVRNFNYKADENKTKLLGLVAQEAETVCPSLVKTLPDVDRDNKDLGTETKYLKYSILYMKAVKALQEAQTRIETLETEKTKLQTDLTALTARVTALEAG